MIVRRSATAPFDEHHWMETPLNLSLAAARTGTHDHYAIELATAAPGTLDRASDALFRYDIFPPRRMRAHVCTRDGRLALGATIIQRVLLGPIVIEMAVRIVDVIDGLERVSFTYATLEGHVERGVATFSVRRQPGDRTVFEIESWSKPGHVLTYLGRPLARLAQRTFTREALSHFRRITTASKA